MWGIWASRESGILGLGFIAYKFTGLLWVLGLGYLGSRGFSDEKLGIVGLSESGIFRSSLKALRFQGFRYSGLLGLRIGFRACRFLF